MRIRLLAAWVLVLLALAGAASAEQRTYRGTLCAQASVADPLDVFCTFDAPPGVTVVRVEVFNVPVEGLVGPGGSPCYSLAFSTPRGDFTGEGKGPTYWNVPPGTTALQVILTAATFGCALEDPAFVPPTTGRIDVSWNP